MSSNILTQTQKAKYAREIKQALTRIGLSASDPIIELTMMRLTSICTNAFFDGARVGIDLLAKTHHKTQKAKS